MMYFVIKYLHVLSDFLLVAGMLINAFVISMVPPTIRVGVIAALRKYDRTVTTAALAGAWIFGIWLIVAYVGFSDGWLHAKLLFVILLSALHGMQQGWMRRMQADPKLDPPAFVRLGMPIILISAVIIIGLAIIKPF
ncbi:CopD family protein [Rhizobium sp. NTR19]|uniref:Protoporphyrinogen IX oxidase n=1 Tax=Neorhizobium turbinariae TaxID=2937795 RepID=A0ABT0ILD5_9HYPH|nr:CopD family protein [Neorhizobium turbinariae]MCK8778646.1 CopD family protein [Neorhizobium turbinariae]